MPIVNVRNKVTSDKFKLEDFLKSDASSLYKNFETYLEGLDLGTCSKKGVLPGVSDLDFNGVLCGVLNACGLELTKRCKPLEQCFSSTVYAMGLDGCTPGKRIELIDYVEKTCNVKSNDGVDSSGVDEHNKLIEGFAINAAAEVLQCSGCYSPVTTIENKLGKEGITDNQAALMVENVLESKVTINHLATLHDVAISNVAEVIDYHILDIASKALRMASEGIMKTTNPVDRYDQILKDFDLISKKWYEDHNGINLSLIKQNPKVIEIANKASLDTVVYPDFSAKILTGGDNTRDKIMQGVVYRDQMRIGTLPVNRDLSTDVKLDLMSLIPDNPDTDFLYEDLSTDIKLDLMSLIPSTIHRSRYKRI